MVIQCENLISLYILPDQRRVNLISLYILPDQRRETKIMKTHSNMVIHCKNLISLYILPDQRRVNLLVYIYIYIYKCIQLFIYLSMLFIDQFYPSLIG